MASPDSPTTSPTLLGLLVRAENDDAWRRFLDVYTPLIDRWCRTAGLQPADAEDVRSRVVAGLVTALKGFSYDPAGKFRGYLRTAVNNAMRSYFRQRGARPGTVGRGGDGPGPLADLEGPAAELAAELDESLTADLRDAYRVVERARGMVEPDTWQAYWLTAIQGKSAAEVGAELGKSVAAVYTARSRVGRLLQAEGKRLRGEPDP